MLTVYLFLVFLFAYAWLFTPSHPAVAVEVVHTSEVVEVMELPQIDHSPVATKAIAPAAKLIVPLADLDEVKPITADTTPVIHPRNPGPSQPTTHYASMTCVELRQACKAQGIRWRIRKGKGRGKQPRPRLS